MTHHWDEFSKSLAQPLPRRESLRRLGVVLAGAVLSPLGLASASAAAKGPKVKDPCDTLCHCRRKADQNQCLAACRACRDAGGSVGGSCGYVYCCGTGEADCGTYCADLASDRHNCGACGNSCRSTGASEVSACIDGQCEYACIEGAEYCGGTCTTVASDPYNCGGCGILCDGAGPNENGECINGTCAYFCADGATDCNGSCTYLGWDSNNCGGCGHVCPASAPLCNNGTCIECTYCNGVCTDITIDYYNCGACGNVCDGFDYCLGGECQYLTNPCDPDGPYFCP